MQETSTSTVDSFYRHRNFHLLKYEIHCTRWTCSVFANLHEFWIFSFFCSNGDYANSQGVPMATVLVPISGILAIAGGLSILFGYKAKWGAWLLVAFLIPVTLMMHAFWKLDDPMQHQMQMVMFMKNTSMLGAAFLIAWFGAGPLSIDERTKKNSL
jgi:putative oxidoreductase